MDRRDIIARLREQEATFRSHGVAHAVLFGSRARGDARPDSDIDIMIEIDPEDRIGVWGYAGLKDTIASLFDGPVDRGAPVFLNIVSVSISGPPAVSPNQYRLAG